MGLVKNDEKYHIWLNEATHFKTGKEIRHLVSTMIIDGAPAPHLWDLMREHFFEDLRSSLSDASMAALSEIGLCLQ